MERADPGPAVTYFKAIVKRTGCSSAAGRMPLNVNWVNSTTLQIEMGSPAPGAYLLAPPPKLVGGKLLQASVSARRVWMRVDVSLEPRQLAARFAVVCPRGSQVLSFLVWAHGREIEFGAPVQAGLSDS